MAGNGDGAAHIGDVVGGSTGLAGIFSEDANANARISASMNVGGAAIEASIADGGSYELGVSTDLGGTAVAFGYAGGDFGAQLSGAASAVDYTVAFASNNNFGLSASTTAGGADLTLSAAEGGAWTIGASMPLGAATVGVELDNAQDWEVSVDTALDAVELGMTFDNDSNWSMSADYAAGAMTLGFTTADTDGVSTWALDATYDLGNGITAGVGTNQASAAYAEVNYDLGGGAALAIEYGDGNDGPDDDIADGTTIAVSFSF
jgi:hypothetical protein